MTMVANIPIGAKFGLLTVLRRDDRFPPHKGVHWFCQCQCGKVTSPRAHGVRSGHVVSCGCYRAVQSAKRGREFKLNESPRALAFDVLQKAAGHLLTTELMALAEIGRAMIAKREREGKAVA